MSENNSSKKIISIAFDKHIDRRENLQKEDNNNKREIYLVVRAVKARRIKDFADEVSAE